MLDSSEDVIAIIDRQGNLEWANKAGERALGYKKKELLGKNIIKIGTLKIPTLPLLALLGVVVGSLVFVGLNFAYAAPAFVPWWVFGIAHGL